MNVTPGRELATLIAQRYGEFARDGAAVVGLQYAAVSDPRAAHCGTVG